MIGLTLHDDVKGATFSEVMVAMALVSVSVMGAMGAFEAADKSLARNALAARALSMAESRVEAKRAAPWGQLLAEDLDHDGVPDLTMHDDGTAWGSHSWRWDLFGNAGATWRDGRLDRRLASFRKSGQFRRGPHRSARRLSCQRWRTRSTRSRRSVRIPPSRGTIRQR